MNYTRAARRALSLSCAFGVTLLPAVAAAQEAEPDAIVVTGSRVIKTGDNSPTPVTVATYESIQTTKPGTIYEGLMQMPIFAGSRGTNANASLGGGLAGGNGAASQINLRNVGTSRTLVLFDGHRVPPTLFSGAIDIDIIPQNILQRVDMVTGGVSAVYGSDAVTGVVNFVTDKAFTGLKGGAQYGISNYGDGQQYSANLVYGRNLGDRAHVLLSYEHRYDKGVDRKSARPWFQYQGAGGAGTSTSPYYLILGSRVGNSSFGGYTTVNNVPYVFNASGNLVTMDAGTAVGNGSIRVGGEGIYQDNNLKGSLRSDQFYGRLDYDIGEDTHLSLVGLGNIKQNGLWGDFQTLSNVRLSQSNPYLTAQAAALIPGTADFNLSRAILDYGYRARPIVDTTQTLFSATLDGKIGGFDWQVYGSYGASLLKTTVYNNLNREKLAAALDVTGTAANPVCSTLASRPDCVPLNLFGATITPTQLDYITDTTHYRALTTQGNLAAQVSGTLFTLPAGDVVGAISGEWRKLAFKASSDAPPELFADCTGLTRNCVSSGGGRTAMYLTTFSNRTKVTQSVGEGAIEVNVPVLKDLPLVRALNLNGAARYTSYDTSGQYWSWKLGGDWKVSSDLRLRGSFSRDIRAPNLFDIATATFIVPINMNDVIGGINPVNNVPSINEANPSLKAEIGKTQTFGGVYTPSWAPGLSLAVDYFHIKVDQAIQTMQGQNARVQAACQQFVASGGAPTASLACMLQSRDPSLAKGAGSFTSPVSAVTAAYVVNYNLGYILTKGFDFELNYNTMIGGRRVSLRALTTYQPHLIMNYGNLGLTPDDLAGYADGGASTNFATPKWRGTVFLGLEPISDLNVDVSYRWRSALMPNANQVWDYKIKSTGTINLNVSWDVISGGGRKLQVYGNVSNLFNQAPPYFPTTNGTGAFNGWVIGDDWVGRYFTIGTRFRF